jgi:predicted small integral membrane protein
MYGREGVLSSHRVRDVSWGIEAMESTMVHRIWSGRVGTPAWWLSCALSVWVCLSVCG